MIYPLFAPDELMEIKNAFTDPPPIATEDLIARRCSPTNTWSQTDRDFETSHYEMFDSSTQYLLFLANDVRGRMLLYTGAKHGLEVCRPQTNDEDAHAFQQILW
jgi:hypothetical protein